MTTEMVPPGLRVLNIPIKSLTFPTILCIVIYHFESHNVFLLEMFLKNRKTHYIISFVFT